MICFDSFINAKESTNLAKPNKKAEVPANFCLLKNENRYLSYIPDLFKQLVSRVQLRLFFVQLAKRRVLENLLLLLHPVPRCPAQNNTKARLCKPIEFCRLL